MPRKDILSNVTASKRPTRGVREKKTFGRVYTPKKIVDLILDLADYRGEKIVGKHVVDNSCGDGAFLTEIVERYCRACPVNLKSNLEKFVHGIEIDDEERRKCLARLDAVAARYGILDVRWDVVCADATRFGRFDAKMDYVFGNPPYVRVHNLGASFDRVKTFEFARGGMTDLYLVFYEIGLRMLRSGGTLGYITPSSFFNSLAGAPLRDCLVRDNLLEKLVDLGHYQVFNATTYATIAVLKKNRTQETTAFYEYDGTLTPIDVLQCDDFFLNGAFYFSSRKNLQTLKEIFALGKVGTKFRVKNGFATLADSFFIGDSLDFEHTIPVVKASTGRRTRCLFPYVDGRLIPYEELSQSPELAAYYEKNVDRLKKRSLENPDAWQGFGRSQGINDVAKPKVAVNSLIRNAGDLKLTPAPPGTGVYGGLYVLSDLSYEEIAALARREEFGQYVALLKKYKSGGYYAFSSKDLKIYLEYAYAKRERTRRQ